MEIEDKRAGAAASPLNTSAARRRGQAPLALHIDPRPEPRACGADRRTRSETAPYPRNHKLIRWKRYLVPFSPRRNREKRALRDALDAQECISRIKDKCTWHLSLSLAGQSRFPEASKYKPLPRLGGGGEGVGAAAWRGVFDRDCFTSRRRTPTPALPRGSTWLTASRAGGGSRSAAAENAITLLSLVPFALVHFARCYFSLVGTYSPSADGGRLRRHDPIALGWMSPIVPHGTGRIRTPRL